MMVRSNNWARVYDLQVFHSLNSLQISTCYSATVQGVFIPKYMNTWGIILK